MYIKIYGEYKVDFDDDIVHAIIDLNTKGFYTKYCCSGHVKGNGGGGYVYFEKQLLRKYGVPAGWFLEYDNERYSNRNISKLHPENDILRVSQMKSTIRYDFPDSENKKQDFIDRKIKNLEKWIKTLPNKKQK